MAGRGYLFTKKRNELSVRSVAKHLFTNVAYSITGEMCLFLAI